MRLAACMSADGCWARTAAARAAAPAAAPLQSGLFTCAGGCCGRECKPVSLRSREDTAAPVPSAAAAVSVPYRACELKARPLRWGAIGVTSRSIGSGSRWG